MAFWVCSLFSGYGIVRSLWCCVPAPLNAALYAIDIISSNSGALFDLSLNDQDLVCILDIIDN
ncbi:hypothetical protein ACSTD6_23075, partial [Vibrio vulnificus]